MTHVDDKQGLRAIHLFAGAGGGTLGGLLLGWHTVCAVEIWAECFGKDPSTIKRSDTYDIFGMLMKIGGWEKYDGNKTGAMRRSPYGPQRCFVRKA